jgi:hypothetical protein
MYPTIEVLIRQEIRHVDISKESVNFIIQETMNGMIPDKKLQSPYLWSLDCTLDAYGLQFSMVHQSDIIGFPEFLRELRSVLKFYEYV